MRPIASSLDSKQHITALFDAFVLTLDGIDTALALVQFPDFCHADALPLLAEQYDVLGHKGFALCTTEAQKRQLIKDAIELHRTKGTPFSIKRAITAVGFDSVEIRERTGISYNGLFNHDGSKNYSGGNWYNFSVKVFYTGAAPDAARIALINKLIEEYKNVRSVLFDLQFVATI